MASLLGGERNCDSCRFWSAEHCNDKRPTDHMCLAGGRSRYAGKFTPPDNGCPAWEAMRKPGIRIDHETL
jgi:hypothetical protein